MKNRKKPECTRRRAAMTVIEVTIVLSVMLMLASVVVFSAAGIDEWKKARNAGMELQSVYIAQKSFLADHPTSSVASITDSDILPYLQGATSIPTVEALDGSTMSIDLTKMPPVAAGGYDPSDSDEDGLWDVGRH
jgi:type II secretory pathway pseudopilin PulG